jgi:hypothetical protein
LAYLPEIEKRLANGSGNAIVLPAPTLGSGSVFDTMETLGRDARDQGCLKRRFVGRQLAK